MQPSKIQSRNPLIKGDTIDEFLLNCKTEQSPQLSGDVVFKMVAICLMSISKFQTKSSPHIQSLIAFILSLLSKLIQITIVHIQESVLETSLSTFEDLNLLISPETENNIKITNKETKSVINLDLNDNKQISAKPKNGNVNGNSKKPQDKSKYLLRKLRRPRKRFNSSDSDGSDVDGPGLGSSSEELNSDISETEEELSQGHEIFDDVTDDEIETENLIEKDIHDTKIENSNVCDEINEKDTSLTETQIPEVSSEEQKNISNGDSKSQKPDLALLAQLKKQNLSPKDVLTVLGKEELLESIKVCFDWLMSHPEMVKVISKSSKVLVQRIVVLLNLLTIDADELLKDLKKDFGIFSDVEKFKGFVESVPLPEDHDLKGLDVLKSSQEILDWKILRNFNLSKMEQTILRTQKLGLFGEFLTKVEEAGVKLDETQKLYLFMDRKEVKPVEEDKVKEDENLGENGNESDQNRGKLMRHMGKLWLKAEVRALESQLRSKLMSAYLVPDHEALAKYMPVLKRLMYAKKFIIVIPSVGEYLFILEIYTEIFMFFKI